MPPTSPSGYPCIAVVHARLFVKDEDRGLKVFLAQLHNGREMDPGVVSKSVTALCCCICLRHSQSTGSEGLSTTSGTLPHLFQSRTSACDGFAQWPPEVESASGGIFQQHVSSRFGNHLYGSSCGFLHAHCVIRCCQI